MAMQRYYYSDTITDFLSRNDSEILWELAQASQQWTISQHCVSDLAATFLSVKTW